MATRKLHVAGSSAVEDERMARVARAAFGMRQRGMDMFEIAEQLQVTEEVVRAGMRITLEKAAELVTDGTRTEALAMELARLDSMQKSLWDDALSGNIRAVEAVLKIIGQRAKLLGLEAATVENVNQTVVVAGDSRAYIEALKSISAGQDGL